VREYGLTLLVTAAVTYLLTPLVRRIAVRVGAVIPPRDRDVHAAPTPRMGGLAMFLGVAAGLLAAGQMIPLNSEFHKTGLTLGLLGGGGVIVLIGVIDDRWGLSAIAKLAGQVIAAGILFYSGAQLNSFPAPHDGELSLSQNESAVLTILVIVATINAVNFIDGLDGLAAGIVFIAASSFFVYYYTLARVVGLSAEGVPALASIVLAGACLGFLPHNFYPAKIFMGDSGSMLLGLLLAYVPIWAINSLDYPSLATKANRFPEILPLLLPAAVLIIPYVDMLRAVVRRTRAGLSPFAADRKHLHHKLMDIGHPHRASVLILYAWAAVFAGTVVGLSFVKTPLIFLAATTFMAGLVLALLSLPRLRFWSRRGKAVPAGPLVAATASSPQVAQVPVANAAVPASSYAAPGPSYDVTASSSAAPGPSYAAPGPSYTDRGLPDAEPGLSYAAPGQNDVAAGNGRYQEDLARPHAPHVSAWQGPQSDGWQDAPQPDGWQGAQQADGWQRPADSNHRSGPGQDVDETAPIPLPIARASGKVVP
jgi:UDP-GlcNAc:undecaprenyl-phosphate/decaprenyl-phosphate GlcNAc-1-phosphate transferase